MHKRTKDFLRGVQKAINAEIIYAHKKGNTELLNELLIVKVDILKCHTWFRKTIETESEVVDRWKQLLERA